MSYIFKITNAKRLLYGIVAWLIQLLAATYLTMATLNPTFKNWHIACIIVGIVILIRGIIILFKRIKDATYTHLFIALILLAIVTKQYVTAALLFLFAVAEYMVNRDWLCTTNREGINITTIPAKQYKWSTLQNAIIAEDYFTIDKKNNQLVQIDISNEHLPFNIQDYNKFVQECINSSN